MSNLPLKALPWEPVKYAGGAANDAQGAGIYYRAIQRDGKHVVYWVDFMGGSDGDKSFDSWDELKDWVETTHYPHKMQPYVVPSPTWISVDDRLPEQNAEVLVRYHAHFDNEEVKEFDVCTAFFYGTIFEVKDQQFYTRRTIKVAHWMPIPEFKQGE